MHKVLLRLLLPNRSSALKLSFQALYEGTSS